ncbi:hypothetical protein PFNF135_05456 [Plasmodium falciparum NF135/5.C10]|uniref:Uncharacterized protein n=2 Tax=Plasmodium falciparum TaxID=5833 RepID=W7K1E5_PLAFO|nr:hypothetical protein PFNF135_05456 [Plasmodium falciparum NF135/5.C10]EWC87139.1 hypothetical protein PFNF54_04066 [Plasmodium falciparum NF54]
MNSIKHNYNLILRIIKQICYSYYTTKMYYCIIEYTAKMNKCSYYIIEKRKEKKENIKTKRQKQNK